MKKLLYVKLIILILLFSFFLVIYINKFIVRNVEVRTKQLIFKNDISNNIENISIDIVSADVNIIKSKDDKSRYYISSNEKLDIKEKNNTIYIEDENIFGFKLKNKSKRRVEITIELNEKDYKKLDIDVVSGNLLLEITFNNIEISSVNLDININAKYKNLDIDSVNSDIYSLAYSGSEIDIDTVNSDIYIYSDVDVDIEYDKVLGNIKKENKIYNEGIAKLKINIINGDIIIKNISNK